MAEARLGVAFQFAVTDEGVEVNLDKEILKLMMTSAAKSVKRRCNDAKNTFLKGVYPASPATWMFFLAAIMGARYNEHSTTLEMLQNMEQRFPAKHRFDHSTIVAICILTIVTAVWVFTGVFQQLLMRKLLSNFTLLNSGGRGKLPMTTKLWLAAVKLLGGMNAGLQSFQKCIPSLPVPTLEGTLKRHLLSAKAFMDEEEYKNLEKMSEEFKNEIGPKLQRYLYLKQLWSPNYVSDWWERFVYLRSRSSLMINSNYYGVGNLYDPPTSVQSARCANMIHSLFLYRKQIDKEYLKPLRLMMVYPLCGMQYVRQFNTTRVPGVEEDQLVHLADSQHVTLLYKGRFFKLTVVFSGILLKPIDIQTKIQKIIDTADSMPTDGEEKLSVLTAAERGTWAEARNKYFSSGINKESLDCVESSAFMVVLDDATDFQSRHVSSQDELNRWCKRMLHGTGYDRWFDKSMNLIVSSNGQVGFNAEHSWADAPIMAQMWEWCSVEDVDKLKYAEDGNCVGKPIFDWPAPKKLKWDLPNDLSALINETVLTAKAQIDDVDLHCLIFDAFGKGAVKKMKISPDAFCQISFQMAYYRRYKKSVLTYESAMVRTFRDGRTETVRPCSIDTSAFARICDDPTTTKEERREAITKAADTHVKLCREAMTGMGVDRHLFCLYVVSQYLKVKVPFLDNVLSEPWTLSTSQTPVNQTQRLDLSKHPEWACAGGGFGPVANDGYGVSYIICGEDIIFLHVSCKNSCPHTSSVEFANLIKECMIEMRNYFDFK